MGGGESSEYLGENNLGREILRRAAQSPCAAFDALGESEVGHFDVTIRVDEQIFGFQITIQDLQMMQVLECEHDLRAVESRVRLGEATHAPQMREHLATRHELQHHKQIQVILSSFKPPD